MNLMSLKYRSYPKTHLYLKYLKYRLSLNCLKYLKNLSYR